MPVVYGYTHLEHAVDNVDDDSEISGEPRCHRTLSSTTASTVSDVSCMPDGLSYLFVF